jgi:A/G-specific adenine glycosylase
VVLSKDEIKSFQGTVLKYYAQNGRHELPWRQTTDPYEIMVSELMLQQTQVQRVIPKYHEFLQTFPTVQALATAALGDVLRAWQGLGYNRRAKFLWQAARQIGSTFPDTPEGLVALPGIGKNTAGAILAYAYNQPAIFIETNVRTVYIHHFFHDQTDVDDKEILRLVEQTITEIPREFYWAIMDYGTHLKQTKGNKNKQSRHYTRQSPFQGSRRQVRGAILRALSSHGFPANELEAQINDTRTAEILAELTDEGFITATDGVYHLS